jgi:LPXTG-site transpeptidase (sortase) family protein
MTRSTRRRLLLLLPALGLLVTACGAPAEEHKPIGGTVYRPREVPTYAPRASSEAEAVPTRAALPTLAAQPTPVPQPTPAPQPTVVAHEALSASVSGGTEAQAHVVPVPSVRPPLLQPLPGRRIVIPTIGVDSKVIQLGTKLDRRGQIAWETAPFAVGQHKGLAGPGQNGNMVLSGHISSPAEGAVFSKLPELKVGEGVIVATDERQFLYRVVDTKIVTPDEVSVMDPTADATATLITCVPDGVYSHRLVVTARLV